MTRQRPHPKLSELRGTLIIGAQRFELTGRSVLIHARLAAATEWLSETPIAQAVVDLAYGRVKVRLTESQPTIEAEDDLGLWAPVSNDSSDSADGDP